MCSSDPEMVRRYEIRFMGRVFVVDMFVLGFEGFDVILGMDWLERHYVSLDCGRRQVVLSQPGTERLVHDCETPGDSIMTSFLYTLEIPQTDVAEVRIVQEFPDVFQEIEGLPPRCVVELRIDLVPGAAPIAKAAYRLAPKELEEMKKQLDDLDRKSTRLNSSHITRSRMPSSA